MNPSTRGNHVLLRLYNPAVEIDYELARLQILQPLFARRYTKSGKQTEIIKQVL